MGKGLHTFTVLLAALLLSAASCTEDEQGSGRTVPLTVTIQVRTTDGNGLSREIPWENRIDTEGEDFRIYLFTNNESDGHGGTLIARMLQTKISTANELGRTKYTVQGEVPVGMTSRPDFKVVAIAGWGSYPYISSGITTIDDICEGEGFSLFNAADLLDGEDGSNRIPFYGVHEYTGVLWDNERGADLSATGITLMRAVAKVEVVRADPTVDEFAEVTITRHNDTGYCAPKGVYLSGDYDHGGEDVEDFTSELHLVGGGNDTEAAPHAFNKTGDDTWVIYLPEYDNSGDDYSCITVSFTDNSIEPKTIFFGNYYGGVCTAYDPGGNPDDRLDLHRNCYYSFSVASLSRFSTSGGGQVNLNVSEW